MLQLSFFDRLAWTGWIIGWVAVLAPGHGNRRMRCMTEGNRDLGRAPRLRKTREGNSRGWVRSQVIGRGVEEESGGKSKGSSIEAKMESSGEGTLPGQMGSVFLLLFGWSDFVRPVRFCSTRSVLFGWFDFVRLIRFCSIGSTLCGLFGFNRAWRSDRHG